jgi:hypothetical protein
VFEPASITFFSSAQLDISIGGERISIQQLGSVRSAFVEAKLNHVCPGMGTLKAAAPIDPVTASRFSELNPRHPVSLETSRSKRFYFP